MRETVGLQQGNSVSAPLRVYLKGVLTAKEPARNQQARISFVDFLLVQTLPSLFHVPFSICITSDDHSLLLPKSAVSNTSVLLMHSLPAALLWRTWGSQTWGCTSHQNHPVKHFWPHLDHMAWMQLQQLFCPTPSAMEQAEIRDWLRASSLAFCSHTSWL